MRKLVLLLCICLLVLPIMAQSNSVEIDGIYYNFITKGGVNEAEVSKVPNVRKIVIPDKINFDGVEYVVTTLGERSFFNQTQIESITIPKTIRKIGDDAFGFNFDSRLNAIYISDIESWMNIEFGNSYSNPLSQAHRLFLNGNEVKDINIPEGYTSLGKYVFQGLENLNSVTIPKTLTSIGEDAFSTNNNVYICDLNAWCSIEFKTLYSVPLINFDGGGHLFYNDVEITALNIPDDVENINDYSFTFCNGLNSVIIPSGVKTIGNYSFYMCPNLKTISIPNTVTSIGEYAFHFCSNLTSITIPSSITQIGTGSFRACNKLSSIIIGNGVKTINSGAFSYCKELADVYCYGEILPSTEEDVFKESYIEYATLHVPESTIEKYKTTTPWSGFKKIVALTSEDPDPTGVSAVKNDNNEYQKYYNFQGIRVNKPSKGLYIVNGKKIVIK